MDEAVRHFKTKGLIKETIDQTSQVRLHKKVILPVELVGTKGILRTEVFDKMNNASQIIRKFKFPEFDSAESVGTFCTIDINKRV